MLIRISAYVPEPTLSTTAIILAPETNANRVVEEVAEKAMYRIGFSIPSAMKSLAMATKRPKTRSGTRSRTLEKFMVTSETQSVESFLEIASLGFRF